MIGGDKMGTVLLEVKFRGSVAFRYAVTTFIGLGSDNGTVVSSK